MKYKISVLLIIILIIFSCKEKKEVIKKIKYITLSFNYGETCKIKDKILLKKNDEKFLIFNNIKTDLTEDKKHGEVTDDGLIIEKKDKNLNKDLYIYKEEDIDFYEKRLKEIEEIFVLVFKEKFKKYEIKINEATEDVIENNSCNINVNAIILNYMPGEFNRIKNIDTELNIIFKIQNKELKIEKKYQKKLIAKAISQLPTERIRLVDLANRYAIIFEQELNKIKIYDKSIKK